MLFDESSSLRYRPKYHVGCLVSFIERLLKIVHYCWEVFMISDFKKKMEISQNICKEFCI